MEVSASDIAVAVFTDWTTDGQETCQFFGRGWNVAQAKRMLAVRPRESYPLVVADFQGVYIKAQDINLDKVAKADLRVPIITVRVGNVWWPVDGAHRIARAIRDNISTLPSVRLTKSEVEQIAYRC